MNVLSDTQAATRQLRLPVAGMLESLSADFAAELQASGTFVEYNQQPIVSPGEMPDYVCCIVAGRVDISRLDADYVKAHVARLGAGEWFGETNIFQRIPSAEEIYADGEVVVWTMPVDTMRNLFFRDSDGVQLLFNLAAQLARKLAAST